MVLVGWEADLPFLRQGLPQWGPMRPWTAIVTLLAGTGLILLTCEVTPIRQTIRLAVAGSVFFITTYMLIYAISGNTTSLETLLYPDLLARQPIANAGRIAPIIALEFWLAAFLIALPSLRSGYVDPLYAVVASVGAGLALTVVIGQLFSAPTFFAEGVISSAAVLASTTNLTLFVGYLLARPDVGALRILRSTSLGGMAARRLIPLVIVIPFALGWALVAMSHRLAVKPELFLAFFSVLTIGMLLTIVFFVARQMEIIDDKRRRAEEAAHRHQERLALAQEVVGAGAWDWDLTSGDCTWSQSYFRLFGLDPATTLASHGAFLDRVHPEDQPVILNLMDKVVPEGGHFRCEYRIIRPDGCLRHMATLATVHHDSEGRPVRVSGLNFDVTDRVTLAQALDKAKQDAEHANLAKSRFLAAASHDLRQPVQSLTLFVEVLQQRLKGTQDEQALNGIHRSADALRQMLDALLDVSRLDAGIIAPKIGAVGLGPLLMALAHEYEPRAQAMGLRLRCVVTRAIIRSDPLLLERMLRNLIENALRYTKRGGVVFGCRRRGDHVAAMVCDSGIGIAPEDQAAIFDEFYQIDNPERDRAKGLGLGLAIVHRMGKLLGHRVSLRSRPGHGSCFTIALPMEAEAPPAEDRPAKKRLVSQPSADEMVLIVEDDQLVREGLGAALTAWGYKVAMAASVAEAVTTVDDLGCPLSLVIADHRLREGETGEAAINAVRTQCGVAIPALVITGDTAPERLREAMEAGVDLVHKPISIDILRETITSLTRPQ